MKKYLLTALLGVFCLFGFTNANCEITFIWWDWNWYSPSSVTLSSNYSFTNSDISWISWEWYFWITNDSDASDNPYYYSDCRYIWWTQNSFSDVSVCSFSAGDTLYFTNNDQNDFNSITLSGPFTSCISSWNGGWSSSSSTPILNASWQAYLWNVLSGVQSVVTELIPYMVYLALAILVASLWFVAIKRLMSWTSKRVTGLFSSRKRK